MEWFVIYVFVMVEKLAALLALGWGAFWLGILLIAFTVLFCVMNAGHDFSSGKTTTFTDNIESRWAKLSVKVGKWSAIVGLLFGVCSYLIPSQKDLAIIVGSGVTYKAVTSETGQRIGGKAIDFLEKKLDDALGDDAAPQKPTVPAKPAVEGKESPKGQAL